MQAASKADRTSSKPRLSLLVSSIALLLLLLLLIAANAGCTTSQAGKAKPSKAPAPSVSPQPPAAVKACPAQMRYNPKTRSCEKIRF
ncbi:MAG: hypothetical protein ABSB96_05930 [Gaiellaceae bacterium]